MDSRRRILAEEQEEYSCIYPTEWQPSGTYQHIARSRKGKSYGVNKRMVEIIKNGWSVGCEQTIRFYSTDRLF